WPDRDGRPRDGRPEEESGRAAGLGRARGDFHGRQLSARGPRRRLVTFGLGRAPLRRLRDVARRPGARAGGVERRLRVLLLAEGARLPPGDLSGVVVGARAGADPRAQAPGPVLLRLRAAGEVLDRTPDHLPPHAADPAVLRAPRGTSAPSSGGD